MKITGQILRENRERKNISISEVALSTKINGRTLTAMEDGNLDQLPPKTFLRGFVRAYATYLGLDVESVLSTFFEEMGTTKPNLPSSTIGPEGELPPDFNSSVNAGSPAGTPSFSSGNDNANNRLRASGLPRNSNDDPDQAINPRTSPAVKIAAAAGILTLVLAIFLFKNKMDSYERETVTEGVSQNIETAQKAKDATDDSKNALVEKNVNTVLPPAGKATPSASPASIAPSGNAATLAATTPTPNVSIKAAASPIPKSALMATATPAPAPILKATPPQPVPPVATPPRSTPIPKSTPASKATPVVPVAPTPPKPSLSPSPTATPIAKAKGYEIILEGLDSVEVTAQIDSEAAIKFQLRADQLHTLKVRRKATLRLSDGGAVNLIVNGVDRGVPGDLGKPTRIEVP
jgi:cytoskeleton protein RodZ